MKNMNKYIKFAVLGVLSWALGACSDDLERDPSPTVSPDCISLNPIPIIMNSIRLSLH